MIVVTMFWGHDWEKPVGVFPNLEAAKKGMMEYFNETKDIVTNRFYILYDIPIGKVSGENCDEYELGNFRFSHQAGVWEWVE